ncbi:NPCBM/NEW2 domain-containing protein [Clostridium botulinum]|nr:NPCBM/NEW2 domain-containing protein [Clostridium botulinum]MCD3197304.1 hypothetical protein [Clostridium botulinum C/D]MCD3203230.1 hypothetical protein [Clostridium botulinum C/D]MCD3210390.1 hypothetical protein [Clostridium botulinum C/D]MCD3214035.1 hypothetical protein [Clostridium botulinum C/D]MCD3221857.1 hypothetical protein [Clostridium botulinum C/D]
MKKHIKILSRFMIFMLIICFFNTRAFAQPIGSNWTNFNEKYNVSLSKSWKVNFSKEISLDKIDGAVIEKDNKFIPVNINISGNNSITITPINNYEPNTRYCLKLFLNNNKKYYMYFNTIKEEIYYLGKDISYMNFKKSNFLSNFNTLYDNKTIEPNVSLSPIKENLKDNIGNLYGHGIAFYDTDGVSSMHLEYPLLNKYRRFKGTIGIETSSRSSNGSISVKIYADDEKVYDKSWKSEAFPENIDLDIQNTQKLIIEVKGNGPALQKHSIGIYNPILIK